MCERESAYVCAPSPIGMQGLTLGGIVVPISDIICEFYWQEKDLLSLLAGVLFVFITGNCIIFFWQG